MQLQVTSAMKSSAAKAVEHGAPGAHAVFAAVHGHAQAIVLLPRPDAKRIRG